MKRIYLHTSDQKKKTAIEKIGKDQKIEIREISGNACNRTVAAICGVPVKAGGAHKQAPVMYVLPELLLFYGMDDPGLDAFLEAYKATGLETVRMKAVVTPTNLSWTLYELAAELAKECGI